MSEELIPIYIMGKRYEVLPNLTILKALEYAGYRLVRGVGCRAGFCGACATVYRLADDYKLRVGLACQTLAQPGMYLTQIPFYPAPRAQYDIAELQPTFATLISLYPQILRCLGCGTCTKVCPQNLDVKEIMAYAMRGNLPAVADKSFDCIMCGLCVSRCPAEELQYNYFILARRLYGRYLAPRARHLAQRVAEIEQGKYDAELQKMKTLPPDELRQMYNSRDIEPETL
jgi:ferredoxin